MKNYRILQVLLKTESQQNTKTKQDYEYILKSIHKAILEIDLKGKIQSPKFK